jgi:PAS domain S-box-containing protein
MSGKAKIILTFSLGAILFISIGIYSWFNTNRYKDDSKWVNHTYEVISKATNVLSYLQDIETSYRGFIITGDENFLTPYKNASRNIDNALPELKDLTGDNSTQQSLVDSIYTLIAAKRNFGLALINLRRKEGFEKTKQMILTNKGEKLMADNRETIQRFINNEKKLLAIRSASEEKRFSSVLFVVVSSIALSVLLLIVAMYYFLYDYKKRIVAEQKVFESELRIKKFLDVLPLGVFIINHNGQAYYANVKSKEILGKGIIGEVNSNELAEIYHAYKAGTDELYPAFEMPIVRAMQGESAIVVEDMEILKNGIRMPLRVNATAVLDANGKTEYAIAVFEDITEIKRAELELINARKFAEESSMLKEAFLANMSHEIRTPMNAIIGFTSILLKSKLEAKEKEFVDIIKSSGENLLRIINDILDISKIEARMMTFDSFPINIRELFFSLKVMMAHKAEAKNLELFFNCSQGVPDILLGDATRLSQIIINLVDNAIKFTSKGSVQVSLVVLSENEDECMLEFTVKDTGIGISEDKLQKVFERFQQAEVHTTRKYGGTGLGLSIARQLVEFQGGQMNIKSTLNIGTEFSFTLPFKKTNSDYLATVEPIKKFEISELAKYRILLAEDSPVNVKLVLTLFSDYDIHADVVENGKEAVEKIKSEHYDLLLMDMDMPEMNGYEATEVIRNELHSQVPIIAMTAHAMAGEKEKCLKLGMNDYISKPINAGLLFEKMYNNITGSGNSETVEIENIKTPQQDKIINLDFLIDMLDGKSKEMVEMIDIFLTEFPKDLGILEKGVANADYNAIRSSAHRMRSTASVVGFGGSIPILQEMEHLGNEKTNIERISELNRSLQSLSLIAIDEVIAEKLKWAENS